MSIGRNRFAGKSEGFAPELSGEDSLLLALSEALPAGSAGHWRTRQLPMNSSKRRKANETNFMDKSILRAG
jgi:hypothetical protein